MIYHLRIIREEDNPNFDELVKDWEEKKRYGAYMADPPIDYPSRTKVTNVLNIYVDEVEFEAIRKAVLETFK